MSGVGQKILFLTVGCINYDCNINFYEPLKQIFSNVINYNYIEKIKQIGKESMNAEIIEVARKERPDYVLLHTYQDQVELETLDAIDAFGIKVIAWFSDDHWRFENYSKIIAKHVFCSVTTDKHSVDKYIKSGLNIIRSQWASNQDYYKKTDSKFVYDVSFVGQNYGKRQENLLYLRNSGVPVSVFGRRFGKFLEFNDIIKVFNASKINLNFSGSSLNDDVKQIKGRVFEVPMCGGFLLTEYVDGIEEYYEIGKEIECFESITEAVEKISYYLKHNDKRMEIANSGHHRALREHTWVKRLKGIFDEVNKIQLGQSNIGYTPLSQEKKVIKPVVNISHSMGEKQKKRVLLTTSAAPSQSPFSTGEKRPPIGIGFLISSLRNDGHKVFFIDNYLQPSNFLETDYLQENEIDYVSDITNIPVADESFDVIICTEVLEHVPEPIEALREMSRILKRGGSIFVTAPLGSGLHQLPYHYYGGLSPQWYRHFFPKFGLQLKEISPNGGFFKLLAQECARVAWTLPQHQHLHGNNVEFIRNLFKEWLPRYLFALDEKCFIDQFTVGYHVEAEKSPLLTIDRTDMCQTVGRNISRDPNMSRIGGLIFSKDRAMQLQATIESFLLHCKDEDTIDLVVLYKTSNELHGGQYAELKKKFSGINFVEESNFGEQVLSVIEKYDYILFLVDDNIFVKPFSLRDITTALQREKDAVGFSLRLGKNTNYCYPFSSQQALPQFKKVSKGILKYYWPDAEYDFGYPLEVSSSVYRCQDMLQLLNRNEFVNPNTLESLMNQNKNLYNSLPYLLTYEESVTFANPVNIVQNVYENKHGTINNYTSEELADCFSQGMTVDVEKYIGLTPNAAHQEAELYLIGPIISSTAKAEDVVEISGIKPLEQYPDPKPNFSIIMANYNNENYIAEAIESVLNQTFRNWEIIIIEDYSTDNSLQIIKRYLNDRRIRLIQHDQNRGYVAALKTGIENVRSEYFGILDSDDCLTSSAIETMYSYHVRFPDCGLIYSQFVFCHEDLTPRKIGFCAEIPADKTNLDADVVSHFKTFKLRDYLKTSGYDEDILYSEDRDICYKMEEVAKLKFVDQCLYLYRELLNSQSHDPVKASIGTQSRQRARLNALRRRGLIPMEANQQKIESVVLEQFAIGHRYALGSSYLKDGRYSEAQITLEPILESLTQHLKCGRSQLSGHELNTYSNMAECYLSVCTKLAQCYVSQGKYDKVKQIYSQLLGNQYIDLPEEQKASIHTVLTKLENIELPAVSTEHNQPNFCDAQVEPLVSVIIPAYNAVDYIKEAIESVLIQNYRNFELLIINDGSTDNTEEVVLGFKDDRIRYSRQANRGLAATHNVGIKQSRSEFIIKLDSDDLITPDYIAKHLQEFEEHPDADLVYCDDCLIDENSKPIRVIERPEYTDRKFLIRDLFRCGFPVVPFRTCIRRSVFDKIGFFDEELLVGEDYDMMRRLVKHGLKIHHLKGALYLRRMTSDSLSRNYSAQKAKSHFDVIKRFIDTFAYYELFPDVAWDEIAPQMRKLHAKCLTAGTYLAIGQDYVKTKAMEYSRTAFDQACSELNDCLKIDPENQGLRQLLQKSKLIRARYAEAPQQVVS